MYYNLNALNNKFERIKLKDFIKTLLISHSAQNVTPTKVSEVKTIKRITQPPASTVQIIERAQAEPHTHTHTFSSMSNLLITEPSETIWLIQKRVMFSTLKWRKFDPWKVRRANQKLPFKIISTICIDPSFPFHPISDFSRLRYTSPVLFLNAPSARRR